MTPQIKSYLAAIGRKGGMVSSEAKTKANRAKMIKRWQKWRLERATTK